MFEEWQGTHPSQLERNLGSIQNKNGLREGHRNNLFSPDISFEFSPRLFQGFNTLLIPSSLPVWAPKWFCLDFSLEERRKIITVRLRWNQMNLRQMGEVNEGIVLHLMEMDITLQWEGIKPLEIIPAWIHTRQNKMNHRKNRHFSTHNFSALFKGKRCYMIWDPALLQHPLPGCLPHMPCLAQWCHVMPNAFPCP